MKEKTATLVCDFDGTLIHCDSELVMVNYFRRAKKFSLLQYLWAAVSIPFNAVCARFEKPKLMRGWCAFTSPEKRTAMIADFLMNGATDISTNSAVAEIVRQFKGKRILLTGSSEEMVKGLLEKLGCKDLFDEVIGAIPSRYGLHLLRHPYGKGKLSCLPEQCDLGIADSYADRWLLNNCTSACVVGEDQKLVKLAEENGWRVLQ